MARVAAHHSRDVAMSGGIVGEHDITGSEAFDRAVAGLDFHMTGQGYDVLASRRVVIIAHMSRRRATKNYSTGRL